MFKKLNIPYRTIQLRFAREKMMTPLFLWRSLQTKLSLGVNNFMQRKRFIYANEEKEGTVYGAGLF